MKRICSALIGQMIIFSLPTQLQLVQKTGHICKGFSLEHGVAKYSTLCEHKKLCIFHLQFVFFHTLNSHMTAGINCSSNYSMSTTYVLRIPIYHSENHCKGVIKHNKVYKKVSNTSHNYNTCFSP